MLVGIILGAIGILVIILFLFAFLIHYRVFGKRWEPDGIVKYYTKEEYDNFDALAIKFLHKGKYLHGFLYSYPFERYKGTIVFSHGMWGSHKAYLQEIEAFAKAGYQVIGFDNYGTELSAGKNIKGLGNSLACLKSAVTYAKNNYPKEKIYVVGHSWGGFAANSIAKYHPDVEAIISLAGFLSVRRALVSLLPKGLYILIPFLILIDFMKCGTYSLVHAKKVLAKTQVRTLLIHSMDDTMVKYALNTGYLQKKIHNPKVEYLIVDGKHHNPDYSIEAIEYANQVMKELRKLPKDQQEAFRKEISYHKMGQLDQEVLQKMVDFLNN